MINKIKNFWMIKAKDGFEGFIHDARIFPDVRYFDARKKIQDGLYEHRIYIDSHNDKMKLISRVFENKSIKKDYAGLNKMIRLN